MKCLSLFFLGKTRKNIIKNSFVEFVQRVARVKVK